jgi:hypothetical protein
MSKEMSEMLLIIDDQLVNDSFVKFKTWELVGVSLDDNSSQTCEMLRNHRRTSLHDENVFTLDFLKEPHVSFNVP